MKQNFTALLLIAALFSYKPCCVNAQVNKQDSFALVALYNDTNGPKWYKHKNWLTSAPVSTWYGVSVSGKRVSGLTFFDNNLKGKFPSSLTNLTSLSYLILQNNELSGSIPAGLGNLTRLLELNLGYNILSGSIPPELGNLAKLLKLSLNYNQLSGSIPPELGNLKSLEDLNLYNNQLSGSIPPALGNLTRLTGLYLYNNHLSSSIPSALSKLISLKNLGLFNNQLSGNIPPELGKLISLKALGLSNNQLSGSIPFALSNLTQLYVLELNYNQFTFAGMGRIARTFPFAQYSPQANIPLNKNGNVLSVSAGSVLANNTYKWYKGSTLVTTITGDSTFTPTQSGNYSVAVTNSVATQLTLYSDTGYVKTTINKNDSLALVDFYNSTDGPHWANHTNWLTSAPVSTWFGITVNKNRVTHVNSLANGVNGQIPASFGNLTALVQFSITYSNLKGNIPSSFGNLVSLQSLYLAYDDSLSGEIPASLGNLTNLMYLYINSTNISGKIPASLGNLSKLLWLRLPINKLYGSIPSSLNNLKNLEILELNFNKLTGTIPLLNSLYNLTTLSLDANKLKGNIPSELGNLTKLQVLDLGRNKLSDTIPSSLIKLKNLYSLDLAYNKFTFAGMGRIVRTFPFTVYSPQATIPLSNNNNVLSVSVGSVLANNTYKWYKGGTLAATITGDSTFQPTQSGNYSVAVTNSIATQLTLYSDTVNYTASNNLITSQINNKNLSITLYPNPAKTNTTLSFNADGKYAITVTDVAGKILQIKTGVANKNENIIQLDVSNYASGMYLITIADEKNKKKTVRLSKE